MSTTYRFCYFCYFLGLTGILFTAQCSSNDTGSALVHLSTKGLGQVEIGRASATATGADFSDELATTLHRYELDPTGNYWQGIITDIPKGEGRLFHVNIFDKNDSLLAELQANNVPIINGRLAKVMLFTQPDLAATSSSNQGIPPFIDALVMTSDVIEPVDKIQCTVQAHSNSTEPTLSYSWSSTVGSFDKPQESSTGWLAPAEEGVYDLHVQVVDSKNGKADLNVSVTVRE